VTKRTVIPVAVLLVSLFGATAFGASQNISGAEHWVNNGPVRLYVWEKYAGTPTGKAIVVLCHGSATAGKESFDLQVPGRPSYSLMDALAGSGFDVFALDTRGFGRSTHPEAHMTTMEASQDLNAVVDYVLKLRGANKVNILAWSWGTQYAGMFVMAEPAKVYRYISYAQMHVGSPDIAKRRPRLEVFRKNPYISIPEPGWKPRFYSMTPAEVNDSAVVDAYAKAAAQVELKSPTGPQLDMVTIMPMVNPRLIPVPTMVIHGQYDDVADLDGLLPFFAQLPGPRKQYVVVPDAGHMMHLQKGHRIFQQQVIAFLSTP
jgi:pimeloyl-ACP methyl ester carboxylesterase